jgi:ribonuclease HI
VSDSKRVVIYTDGGCAPNPGIGGWAATMRHGTRYKEISGGELDSTNNRMELMAAIESLKTLKGRCSVQLITDSQYVKNGVNEWMPGWKARGWKRKTGAIKNLELWKALDEQVQRHDILWDWVKGHSGVVDNERCDVLCTMEIEKIRSNQV